MPKQPTEKRQVKKKTIARKSSKSRKGKPSSNNTLLARAAHARKNFLARRPHRSFRLTRRRDYKRTLKIPGYIAFTWSVFKHLAKYKNTFLCMILIIGLANMALIGIVSQDNFLTLSEVLREVTKNLLGGGWGEIVKGGALFASVVTGSFGTEQNEIKQVFTLLIGLTTWLTTVWLLRAQFAGRAPRLRDGFYNAGSPIVSTGIVAGLFMLQLLPAILGIIVYNEAAATNALANGAIAMMASITLFLLVLLSLYWVTSTAVALIVVTLPGMYPWQAVRTAGDLVVGRRVRILLRLVWLCIVSALIWIIVMVPIVTFAAWLQTSYEQIAWVPVVPCVLLFMSAATMVFYASYIYMLYRKMVEDGSAPA